MLRAGCAGKVPRRGPGGEAARAQRAWTALSSAIHTTAQQHTMCRAPKPKAPTRALTNRKRRVREVDPIIGRVVPALIFTKRDM